MTDPRLIEVLCRSTFFAGTESSQMMQLLARVHYQVKSYEKNSLIAAKGESCEFFQLVVEGSVRGEMVDPEGKVLKIENVGIGQTIAVAFLFGRNAIYPVNVVAHDTCRIFRMTKSDLLKMLQTETRLLESLLVHISEKAQFLSGRIHFLSLRTIKGKIAAYLLQKQRPHTPAVVLDRTQGELAEFFGVTRPALARALKQLEEDAYLSVKGRTIVIINSVGLQQLAH